MFVCFVLFLLLFKKKQQKTFHQTCHLFGSDISQLRVGCINMSNFEHRRRECEGELKRWCSRKEAFWKLTALCFHDSLKGEENVRAAAGQHRCAYYHLERKQPAGHLRPWASLTNCLRLLLLLLLFGSKTRIPLQRLHVKKTKTKTC